MMRRLFAAIAAAMLGCGPAGPPRMDAGSDAGVDAGERVAPAAPAAPAPPRLDPCPAGWAPVSADGEPDRCEPFPDGWIECAAALAHVPGMGCVPIGTPCDEPPIPEGAARVLHVAAGGSGDGSPGAPFGTIGEAIAAAADGDAIVVEPGSYDELVMIDRAVTLVGACPSETIVRSDAPSTVAGVITVTDTSATITNLSVTGARAGIVVEAGASATLSHVVVADTQGIGIGVGGEVTVEDGLLSMSPDTPSQQVDGTAIASGIWVFAGGRATVRRVHSHGHRLVEAAVEGSATFEEVTFGAGAQRGMWVTGDATVRRSVFHRAGTRYALDVQSAAVLEDVVLREHAHAIEVASGASLTFSRGAVDEARRGAITAQGSTVSLTDVIVRGGGEDAVEHGLVNLRGSVALERVWVGHTQRSGIVVAEGDAVLSDVEVTDVRLPVLSAPRPYAFGLLVYAARASVARVRAEDLDCFGVGVIDSEVEGTDVEISGVRGAAEVVCGIALAADQHDGVSAVTLTRVALVDNAAIAGVAFGVGTRLALTDLTTARTTRAFCMDASCGSIVGGIGLTSVDGAELVAERFVVEDSELAGVSVGYREDDATPSGEELRLVDGLVTGNAIGINVSVAPFDVEGALERVVVRENGRNLAGERLSVPSPPLIPDEGG